MSFNNKRFTSKWLLPVLMFTAVGACKKFVEVSDPVTSQNASLVYNSDASAASVLTGIYSSISQNGVRSANLLSFSLLCGLSSDELDLYNPASQTDLDLNMFYKNALSPTTLGKHYWTTLYPFIFRANDAIAGLNNSTTLTAAVKNQLLGEAHFVRAICYYYLTNLYGDIPLATSTDWLQNAALKKIPQSEILDQVVSDLKNAQSLMSVNFLGADALSTSTERARPNKWAALSLLARTYLLQKDYVNAESAATQVLQQPLFDTVSLSANVFLKNSKEAIWQMPSVGGSPANNTPEGRLFKLPSTGPDLSTNYPVVLSKRILQSFDKADLRLKYWVDSVVVNSTVYYYPNKYKFGSQAAATSEYSMMFRLGEIYLIRAEARANQNSLVSSQQDLNVIRKRAGISLLSLTDKTALLDSIMTERKRELFTESGHRWFDLKRTGTVDQVMQIVTPLKGGTWSTTAKLFPLPASEISLMPTLTQNQGY